MEEMVLVLLLKLSPSSGESHLQESDTRLVPDQLEHVAVVFLRRSKEARGGRGGER
jgi:hypothetical protein